MEQKFYSITQHRIIILLSIFYLISGATTIWSENSFLDKLSKVVLESSVCIFPILLVAIGWKLGVFYKKQEFRVLDFYKKSFKTLIFPYILCLIPFAVYNLFLYKNEFSCIEVIRQTLSDDFNLHFLYAVVLIIIILFYPLLRKAMCLNSDFLIRLLLGLSFMTITHQDIVNVINVFFSYVLFLVIGMKLSDNFNSLVKIAKLVTKYQVPYLIIVLFLCTMYALSTYFKIAPMIMGVLRFALIFLLCTWFYTFNIRMIPLSCTNKYMVITTHWINHFLVHSDKSFAFTFAMLMPTIMEIFIKEVVPFFSELSLLIKINIATVLCFILMNVAVYQERKNH